MKQMYQYAKDKGAAGVDYGDMSTMPEIPGLMACMFFMARMGCENKKVKRRFLHYGEEENYPRGGAGAAPP